MHTLSPQFVLQNLEAGITFINLSNEQYLLVLNFRLVHCLEFKIYYLLFPLKFINLATGFY